MEKLSAYDCIARKIDEQDPHTAPKMIDGSIHAAFIEHLKLTYTPEEAEIIQHLNLLDEFTSSEEIAAVSGKELSHVQKILKEANRRNGIVGLDDMYCIPPVPLIVNIQQFRTDIQEGDIKAAELYQEYFIDSGFYKFYEASKKGTPMARIIPVKKAIEETQKVLGTEEAHEYIMNHSAEELALVPCPCRVRSEKMGDRECKDKFPIAACLMMGMAAVHFTEIGAGEMVSKRQAIDYFDEMVELGLIGQTFNASYGDMVICLCCGCCCSQVRGRTKWNNPDALGPANFVAKAGDDCLGCEMCIERCLLGAITMDDDTEQVIINHDKCIGCGICTLTCPQETLKLYRFERSIPPATSQELLDRVAIENREV